MVAPSGLGAASSASAKTSSPGLLVAATAVVGLPPSVFVAVPPSVVPPSVGVPASTGVPASKGLPASVGVELLLLHPAASANIAATEVTRAAFLLLVMRTPEIVFCRRELEARLAENLYVRAHISDVCGISRRPD